MEVIGSFLVNQNHMWSSNILYKLFFLHDRLLFVRSGGQFASQGGLPAYIANTIGALVLAPVGAYLYGLVGAIMFAALGGGLGAFVGSLLRKRAKKKTDEKLEKLAYLSVDEVLRSDKRNFVIPYGEISDIKIKMSNVGLYGARKGLLLVEAGKELKFDIDFAEPQPLQTCDLLVSLVRQHPLGVSPKDAESARQSLSEMGASDSVGVKPSYRLPLKKYIKYCQIVLVLQVIETVLIAWQKEAPWDVLFIVIPIEIVVLVAVFVLLYYSSGFVLEKLSKRAERNASGNIYFQLDYEANKAKRLKEYRVRLLVPAILIGLAGSYVGTNLMVEGAMEPAEGYVQAAKNDIEAGDYDSAIGNSSKAIEKNHGDAVAYYLRGFAYEKKHEYEKAIPDYERTRSLRPDIPETYNELGNVYKNLKKYDLALANYNKVIELKPEWAFAYDNRGTFYQYQGRFDLAIVDHSKAIELDPNDPDSFFNRGSAYEKTGQHELAILDYFQAVQINPKYSPAYENRGTIYLDRGQYDLALSDYNKVLEIDPGNAEGYYSRGSVYDKKRQYDLAIDDYSKAISIRPQYARAYNNRGLDYALRGQYDLAVKDLTKAVELAPGEAYVYYSRGYAYFQSNERDKAIADYNKVLELSDDPIVIQDAKSRLKALGQ